MGLFKKIFKPVAKVLDKIIPNEIKPALPYIAAAPFAPAGFGPGCFWYIWNTMGTTKQLLSGGLNILGQFLKKVVKVILIYYQRDSERCQVL